MIAFLDFVTLVVQLSLTLLVVGGLVAAVVVPQRSVRRPEFSDCPPRRGGRHRRKPSPPACRPSRGVGVRHDDGG